MMLGLLMICGLPAANAQGGDGALTHAMHELLSVLTCRHARGVGH